MKDIVIITAHCDDSEKIDMLNSCIDELKSQNYPIIVSSHIKVPQEIYDKVDYVIYDKENPIIYSHEFDDYGATTTWFWTNYDGFYQDFTFDFNHAYAVLKLIKNGVAIANSNGYEVSHVICYDYLIKDKNLLSHHSETLNEYDVYSYDFGTAFGGLSAGLFSFKNDKFLDSFSKINSKQEYASCTYAIFEEFLEKIFIKNSAKIFKKSIDYIREDNEIDKITANTFNRNNIKNKSAEQVAYLFLTKVEDNYYIYIISFSEITLKLKIGSNSYQLKPINHKSYLIPIDELVLNLGIHLSLPEVDFYDFYDKETRFSIGKIEEGRDLTINLEDIKI